MTYSNYFRIAEDLNDNSDNFAINYLEDLMKENNLATDLKALEIFLKLKRDNDISAASFLYAYSLANVKEDIPINDFVTNMSNILGINNFDISGNKMGINGFKNLNDYSYRITFSNSNYLAFSDIQLFFEKFNIKENNLSYGLKIEPNVSDVLILYLSDSDLGKTIDIIESLKYSDYEFLHTLNKFGKKKPFTACVENSSYGISMGTSKLVSQNFKGFFAIGNTFTEYSARLLETAYLELVEKNNGNNNLINSNDLYEMMKIIHKKNYGFFENENIPLWMNGENYISYINEKNNGYNK